MATPPSATALAPVLASEAGLKAHRAGAQHPVDGHALELREGVVSAAAPMPWRRPIHAI